MFDHDKSRVSNVESGAFVGHPALDPQPPRERFLGVRLLILGSWLQAVFPSLLQLEQRGGRGVTDVAASQALTGLSALLSQFLSLALLIGTVGLVIHHAHSQTHAPARALLFMMAPWLVMMLLGVRAGSQPRFAMLLYPLTALALWLIAPPIRVLATLGLVTSCTAALALVMGGWTTLGLVRSEAFGDKEIFGGGLLAGPYNNSNGLGMVLALGLPAMFLVRSRGARAVGISLILPALVWTAARTSLAAAAVLLLLLLLFRVVSRPTQALVASVVLAVGLALVVWLPFHVNSITAYSFRGLIWLASRATWQKHPWLGAGPDYYRIAAQSANDFGRLAFHGHNLAMHMLTVGGLVLATTVGITLLAVSHQALRLLRTGVAFPVFFVVTYTYVSALDLATDFREPSPAGLAVWFSLALCLFARESVEAGFGLTRTGGRQPVVDSGVHHNVVVR